MLLLTHLWNCDVLVQLFTAQMHSLCRFEAILVSALFMSRCITVAQSRVVAASSVMILFLYGMIGIDLLVPKPRDLLVP